MNSSRQKEILGIIPARARSKRIVKKSLVPLGEKNLIQYTLEAGEKSSSIDRLVLSTDDPKIIQFASGFDIEIPFTRPKELATDNSSSFEVVQHCLNWMKENEAYFPDAVILLQPTCPFRDKDDIDSAISQYIRSQKECLISVCEVTQHPCDCIKMDGDKIVAADRPLGGGNRDFPEYYFINGAIHITSVGFLNRKHEFYDDSPELFVMSKEHSIDIDNVFDLRIAESLIRYKKKEKSH